MVIISGDALEEWQTSGYARHRWVASLDRDPDRKTEDTKARDESVEHWRTGSELYDNLRFESGQLDLMAGPGLRDVAARLVREHESIRHWIRPASGADDWLDLLITHGNTVIQLHKDLVNQARAELGVDQLDMKRRLRALLPPSRKAPGPPMF